MKKLLLVLVAAATLFSSCADGSSNDDDNEKDKGKNEGEKVELTLKQLIVDAKSGDTLDLGSVDCKIDADTSYTINKPMTIKNGDVKNSTFIVESDKVMLENLMNIKTIMVSEKVGEGDFTLSNCYEVSDVYVNGGGTNSVNLSKTNVKKLSVNKKNVHIKLADDGTTKVENTFIFVDCKLDSLNKENSFGNVAIDEAVQKLELAGVTALEKIVSKATAGKVAITINVNVVINKIDETIKNNITGADGADVSQFVNKIPVLTEEEKTGITGALDTAKNDLDKIQDEISNPNDGDKSNDEDKPNKPADNGKKAFTTESTGITIEDSDTETKITNANAKSEIVSAWDSYITASKKIEAKTDKNYKISIDLKSDNDAYVYIFVKDESGYNCSIYNCFKIGNEYKTYNIETGSIPYDWLDGKLCIATGCVSTLYAKNLDISELSTPSIGAGIYYAKNEDIGEFEFDGKFGKGIGAAIKFNKGISEENNYSGVNLILNKAYKVGKLYKISFDVTSDISIDGVDSILNIYAHCLGDSYESASTCTLSYNAYEQKKVTLYLPIYKLNNESVRIPYIWFQPSVACTLKIENISAEETTLESILEDDHTYLGGVYNALSKGKSFTPYVNLSSYSGDYRENIITTFSAISPKSDTRLTYSSDGKITNNTQKTLTIDCTLDEEYKVIVKTEDLKLDSLYLAGDFNSYDDDGQKASYGGKINKFNKINETIQEYEFVYHNDMSNWGGGNGLARFKVCYDADAWVLDWGASLDMNIELPLNGEIFLPLEHRSETNINPGNIVAKGFVDGETYKITLNYDFDNLNLGIKITGTEGEYTTPEPIASTEPLAIIGLAGTSVVVKMETVTTDDYTEQKLTFYYDDTEEHKLTNFLGEKVSATIGWGQESYGSFKIVRLSDVSSSGSPNWAFDYGGENLTVYEINLVDSNNASDSDYKEVWMRGTHNNHSNPGNICVPGLEIGKKYTIRVRFVDPNTLKIRVESEE